MNKQLHAKASQICSAALYSKEDLASNATSEAAEAKWDQRSHVVIIEIHGTMNGLAKKIEEILVNLMYA